MTPDSRLLFLALLALVALERLVELAIARRHERALVARGAIEHGRGHYPIMVALHTGVLVSAGAEVWFLARPFVPALGWSMLAVIAGTMALRYWVIATLGDRWTTRVVVPPEEPPLVGGPFRWLRHPNYLAVAIEVPALALVHNAWLTASFFGVANLVLLRHRISVEDRALGRAPDPASTSQ